MPTKENAAAKVSLKKPPLKNTSAPKADLFERVVSILEEARSNVVRAVNSNMVITYWLIGREIVQEVQGGAERAEYGKQVLSDLSTRLTQRYGNGYSVPNLQNFRKFYLAFNTRVPLDSEIQYPAGVKSAEGWIQYPMGTKSSGFSPQLSCMNGY